MTSEVKVGQLRRWKLGRPHAANGLVFRVESVSSNSYVKGIYQSEGHVGNPTWSDTVWMEENSEVLAEEVYDPQKPFTLKVVVKPEHWKRALQARRSGKWSVCRDCAAGAAINDALKQRFNDDQIYATCAWGSVNIRRPDSTTPNRVLAGTVEQSVYCEEVPPELEPVVRKFDGSAYHSTAIGPCPSFELRFNPSKEEMPHRPLTPTPAVPPKEPKKLDVSKLKNPYLVVNVTAKDIAEARQHRSFKNNNEHWLSETCPVALAATRALRARFRRHPGIRAQVLTNSAIVAISPHLIGKDFEGKSKTETDVAKFELPSTLRSAVYAFDTENEVKPVRTVVRLVPKS